jgi:hypothetical protein
MLGEASLRKDEKKHVRIMPPNVDPNTMILFIFCQKRINTSSISKYNASKLS